MAALDFPNSPTNGDTFTSPNGGAVYTWDGTKWLTSSVASNTAAPNNVGRNLIHNPLFNIVQRGAGPFTLTGAYTLDRWIPALGAGGDTVSITQALASDANRADIGDEVATFVLNTVFTGGSAAANVISIIQRIEGVRRLAGQTVTVSFYANANTASLKVGVSIDQVFGTGGSPSATVNGVGQAVTLSATVAKFARYSVTFVMPSVAGKTLGTSGTDLNQVNFWLSSGTTSATRAGNIGVQSGTINLWGVQLEVGSTATPLEKPDPQQDLAKCQRFFVRQDFQVAGYAGAGATPGLTGITFPVTMRAPPTITYTPTYSGSCSGLTAAYSNTTLWTPSLVITTGWFAVNGTYTASADL